jgi:D-amino-acid dehydrogenase
MFVRRGGRFLVGDAESLHASAGTWSVNAVDGNVEARNAVIALGPQSAGFARRFGYRLPFLVKRGYHRHYRMNGAMPSHPIVDKERGFVLSPMTRGIRLTTGVEFAELDAPPNPRQLREAEAAAALLLPLGDPVEEAPWLGARLCPADMRPIVGPAPGTEGLWFNFGHAHHGLTVGPTTGRLLAEMLAGENTFVDPAPYSAGRFS